MNKHRIAFCHFLRISGIGIFCLQRKRLWGWSTIAKGTLEEMRQLREDIEDVEREEGTA